MLEVQIVENLQRDDLTAMEEAEGYEALITATGISKDALGTKIGKSSRYVYARLQLLHLTFESQQALRKGAIDFSRALLIARVPDAALQAKALEYATTISGYLSEVPSVRALQNWLSTNVMLQLANAPFQITDASLCPDAGSCKTCHKRTGANPDLFSDVPSADVCTDPPCYHAKSAAHHAQLVAKAEAQGLRIIDGKEAAALFKSGIGYGNADGYSRMDQRRQDVDDEGTTLKQLLAGEDLAARGIQPVLIEHPRTKELIEAVPTAETEALLITRGLIKQTRKAEDSEREIQYLKESIERKTYQQGGKAIFAALVSAVHASPTAIVPSADLARAWLINQCGFSAEEDLVAAFKLPDINGGSIEDRAAMAAQRASIADVWKALVILMMTDDQPNSYPSSEEMKAEKPLFAAVAAITGVDTDAILKATRADIKAEVAEQISALKAQAEATKPEPTAAPAPATPKAKPARQPKTTQAEAQAKIASAMQAQELEPADDAPGDTTIPMDILGVGARVKVLPSARGPKQIKYVGKIGTVKSQIGPAAWDVLFTAKGRGVASYVSFHTTELKVE